MIVCLDTCTLIYMLNTESADPAISQNPLNQRARQAVTSAQDQKATLIIPTIVLAEFLHGFTQDEAPRAIQTLLRLASLAPFDISAAIAASRLKTPRPKKVPKNAFKVDIMIAASAIAKNAKYLITYDPHLSNLLEESSVTVIQDFPIPEGHQRRLPLPDHG